MLRNVLIKIGIFCVFAIICLDTYGASNNIRNVATLEVRGLSLLAKTEIIRGSCSGKTGGGITIDLALLDRQLRSIPLVARYAISDDKDRVTVNVTEKKVLALLAIQKEGRLIPFEVDENFTPLRGGRIYSPDNPLIVLKEGGSLTPDVKQLIQSLDRLRTGDAEMYREIAEIHMNRDGSLDVFMKNRRTDFVAADRNDFFRIVRAAVSYLDVRGQYPGKVILGKEGFVLR